jgi:alpha-galactosidase
LLTEFVGHEDVDAQSFAEWGADTLKYDNCYAVNDKDMNNGDPEFSNPSRFQKMADSLNKVGRDIQYFVCQWGNGDNVGDWYVATHSL